MTLNQLSYFYQAAVLLDDHHGQALHRFIGGKAALAPQALPAAADAALVGRSGIHHLALLISAIGTLHCHSPFCTAPTGSGGTGYCLVTYCTTLRQEVVVLFIPGAAFSARQSVPFCVVCPSTAVMHLISLCIFH